MMRAFFAGFLVWCALTLAAVAHEVRPAYLELRETAPDTYDVLWKVPANGEMRLAIYVRLPADARQLSEPRGMISGAAHIERWRIQRPGGLDGQSIAVEGLSSTKIDTLVRVTDINGVTQTFRATPDSPSVTIAAAASGWQVARTYTALGIEHILLGVDHLLFVLSLVLLVKGRKRLIGTITAFTIAHSITLALAALGVVHVPGPPVEACIALSIVFVAAEILRIRAGKPSLNERSPWVVAFTFGLLHGLGFAGALSEVGLPQHAIPLALLFFNVGVELGQLAFIAAVLAVAAVARRVPLPHWAPLVPPYAIGAVAMFWVIERVAAFHGTFLGQITLYGDCGWFVSPPGPREYRADAMPEDVRHGAPASAPAAAEPHRLKAGMLAVCGHRSKRTLRMIGPWSYSGVREMDVWQGSGFPAPVDPK